MEILLLLIALAFLIWILIVLTSSNQRIAALQDEVDALREDVKKWRTAPEQPKAAPAPPPVTRPVQSPAPARLTPEPARPAPVATPAPLEKAAAPAPAAMDDAPEVSAFRRWLHDNPDLERFIGENLFNKIGIAILVLGIAFFVKYAIDQEWIGEIGRVAIGFVCGGLLLALAHRVRKGYHSFSSVLVGGGLSVFYFTVAFAFHQYHLISQVQAFTGMVAVTALAIVLSIGYDRLELGILATLGGFVTPFLVSNGQSNYQALFTYLCILDTGLIVLAYYKKWRSLNFLAFFFTQFIYLGWIINAPSAAPMGTFVYGAVFYVLFTVMNVIHHAVQHSRLLAFDFIILLTVNLAFYGAGYYLLGTAGYPQDRGVFTLIMGVINLALTWLFLRQKAIDRNFVYLLIGLTLTFLSMVAPIQLKAHYITLFWGAESVVLFWLYQKSFIRLLKVSSALIALLTVFTLFMDWMNVYTDAPAVIFNPGFATGIFCASCLLCTRLLAQREGDLYYLGGITNRQFRRTLLVAALSLYYLTGALELYIQCTGRLEGKDISMLYLTLYTTAFSLFLFRWLPRLKVEPVLLLLVPMIPFIVYLSNTAGAYGTEVRMLTNDTERVHFWANWADDLLLLILLGETIRYIRRESKVFKFPLTGLSWIISVALVTLLSLELQHLFVWLYYTGPASIGHTADLYGKAGLSILWGVCAFALISIGLSRRFKPLRIIALFLFGITLLKLFCYDIIDIPPAGKIIAFILLGVLLLVISFMYQRLKKILLGAAPPSAQDVSTGTR